MENRLRNPRSLENRRRNRRSVEKPYGRVCPVPPNVQPLTDLSNPPTSFYRRPIPRPLADRYPSRPRLGTCRGCFRSSETEPLSEIQCLDYPWGGYLGPGEIFIKKFRFEVEGHFNESSLYLPEEKRKPNTYELVTTFLKQVRQSKGYDVNCCPPGRLSSPFTPLNRDMLINQDPIIRRYYQRHVLDAADYAIETINVLTGENYKLGEIEKAVDTINMLVYLTFTAKDGMGNVCTFQAMLGVPFGDEPIGPLMEFRFKPDVPATSGA